ncbi:single-strand DNA-binding protein [Elusimicrobium simillimum]|uniref:single-stranded DNA-binding protein n=1 Tax=Elusimicrobium simillimum TaxID=3143438 RepID=UPI003C6F1EEC
MSTQTKIPEINIVMLSGRLTKDANIAYTQKGAAVCRFDIAVNRRYMDASQVWQDEVTFVPVTLWGPAAERAKDRLVKGAPVLIEGRLVLNEYTDAQGKNHKRLQVNCKRVQILQSTGGGGPVSSKEESVEESPAIDDDIPF